jgi:tripartite-type tricarboxylate transporter receptor subunit TctC
VTCHRRATRFDPNEKKEETREMRTIVRALFAFVVVALPAVAPAQTFPSRPITIVVPFPPGGVTDPVARMAGQKVTESTGQPVVVDNRPGGGGLIGAEIVKRAAPDGHTLFFGHFGTHAVNPYLYSKLPYDAVKDFQPITLLISTLSILVVPAESPAKTLTELIQYGRTKPGGLNYASQGIGSGGHLLGEMMKARTGLNMTHVPYRGSAPAVADLLAGRGDLFFDALITSGPHVRDGKFRALGITSTKRHPLFPDVPTMAEAGMADMELDAWFGLFAPAGTPPAVVRKLNEEFVRAMKQPDVVKRFSEQGLDVMTNTPEEFAALIARDSARLGKVVKESGARAD